MSEQQLKRLVWSILRGGNLKLVKFVGADAKRTANGMAVLVEYVRSQKHMARVLAGETKIASIQMSITPEKAREVAALLIRIADQAEGK